MSRGYRAQPEDFTQCNRCKADMGGLATLEVLDPPRRNKIRCDSQMRAMRPLGTRGRN